MKIFFTRFLTKSFFILLFIGFVSNIRAQEIPVTFKIINSKKQPVAFATVHVFDRADTLKSDKKISDSTGTVLFNLLKGSQYIVSISSVNYQTLEKGINVASFQNSFTFSLEDLPKTLSGVVVTSSKPLMRQEDDKTIIDPENLVAASTNGYEVLEKTPGLFIDQDGNIYISSLSPATVQINGRDMKMSAADVATLLKSLPPTAILKIEILRTPSAKYDASSTGGIVNVVLKKGVKIGITGSVNGGIQQGNYGSQYVGLNLNNNNGKKSSSFNVNYNRRNYYERITNDRQFVPDSVLSQDAFTKYPSDAWFGQYIVTYAPGKWEIELSGQATLNLADNETNTRNIISKISNGQVRSDNNNFIANENRSVVIGAGIEPRLKIDTLGSEWSSNIYYFNSQYTSEQVFTTTYTIPANAVGTGGDGIAENKRDLLSVKSDLKLKMRKRFTLEAGLKSTIHNFKNVTNYYDEKDGIRTKNEKRTNTYHYDENINALYLQGSQTFGKDVVLKFGTRLENTNMEGRPDHPE